MRINKTQALNAFLYKITLIFLFVFTAAAQANPPFSIAENDRRNEHSAPHPKPRNEPVEQHKVQQHNIKPQKIHNATNIKTMPHNEAVVIEHQEINKKNKTAPKVINQPIHQEFQPVQKKVLQGVQINNGNVHLKPKHVVLQPNQVHQQTHITQNNINNAAKWNQQFIHQPNNAQWVTQINGYQHQYHNQYNNYNIQSYHVYGHYWQNPHYHNWYNSWYKWGFFGGFWYPLQPAYNIENYFSYPAVQWFYVDEPVTTEYYSSYYVSQPPPPNSCMGLFPYKHIYFPSDALLNLLVEVSGFSQDLRCNFRAAVIHFTAQIKHTVSNNFSINFLLHQNNLVISSYQNLQNQGILINGFVNQGNINMAFEALLDLQSPNQSIVFAPSGQNPSQNQLQELEQFNNRIINLGGNPYAAQQTLQPGTAYPGNNTDSVPGP